MDTSFSLPISRRDFMKLAGLGAAGALFGGAPAKALANEIAPAPAPVNYNPENLPTLAQVDVCVAGGGPGGTAAAINAARGGARVALVEKGISLGGLQTMGCVMPFMPTFAPDSATPYIKEVTSRLEAHGIDHDDKTDRGAVWFNPEVLTLIYDEMCEEAGVNVLYNTTLIGAATEGQTITAAIVSTIGGVYKIEAKTFIDGSGDAMLARFAGVPTEKGSEKTGLNQQMSLRFEMGGVDYKKLYSYVKGKLKDEYSPTKLPYFEIAKTKVMKPIYEKGVADGELTPDDIVYIQAFTIIGKPGVMSMNCPEMPANFSATDPVSYSRAVSFGRRMMRRLAKFYIKNIPGFQNAFISREASIVGVRESWRIRGQYRLVAEDYFNQSRFADAVVRTAYPIDVHDVKLDFAKKLPKGGYYEIPYRSLVTREIRNLAVVGRCISASFAAQASVRIQPTCMSMGEAAGVAAAWGLAHGLDIGAVRWEDIPAGARSYVSAG